MRLSAKTNTSRPLEALGVSEMEERVYRALLKHRLATANDVAAALPLQSKLVRRLLDALRDKGLVTGTLERIPRYTATSPELAIEALANRRLADIERARLIIPELKDCVGSPEGHEREQVVELITDQTVLGQTVLHIHQTAKRELMGLQRAPLLIPPTRQQVLKKYAPERTISDNSYLELPGALEMLRMSMRTEDEARICSSLPIKMVVADRRIGLIPLNVGDPDSPSLLIRKSALLDALCSLFEFIWERATPISITPDGAMVTSTVASGLSEGAQNLITLLATGLNDKAIALEANMSETTLTRRIAELMRHYDARTRFQLGWHAALEAFPGGKPKAM